MQNPVHHNSTVSVPGALSVSGLHTRKRSGASGSKNVILEVGMTPFRKYHRQTKITSHKCGAAGGLQKML